MGSTVREAAAGKGKSIRGKDQVKICVSFEYIGERGQYVRVVAAADESDACSKAHLLADLMHATIRIIKVDPLRRPGVHQSQTQTNRRRHRRRGGSMTHSATYSPEDNKLR